VHGVVNGSTPVFTYYNSSYNGNTPPLTLPVSILDVRLIKISIITDDDPSKPPSPINVTTQVSFRNLKDNL